MSPRKPKKPAKSQPRTPKCCACGKGLRTGIWTSAGLLCPKCTVPMKIEVAS